MVNRINYKDAEQALQEFLDSCYAVSHSTATVNGYKNAITGKSNGFRKFLKEKYDYNEIELCIQIKSDMLDVYQILKNYVIFLDKARLMPNSIKQFFHAVKGYLIHLGIEVYSEKCKQFIKLPKILRRRKEPITKEMLARIMSAVSFKLRVVFLVALSSGMRIGEIGGLRLSDIDFTSTPTRIRIRAETTKTREERETFLTSEATVALKDYLRKYFEWEENQENIHLKNRNIFGRTSIGKYIRKKKLDEQRAAVDLLENILHEQLKRIPEFSGIGENGRRIFHFHALREFFYTTSSNAVGSNFAHALMGHHSYLDTYYSLSEKDKIKLYQKCEPYLTISDFSKIEEELEKTKERQDEIVETYTKLSKFLKQKDPSFEKFMELTTS
jgi:integrase